MTPRLKLLIELMAVFTNKATDGIIRNNVTSVPILNQQEKIFEFLNASLVHMLLKNVVDHFKFMKAILNWYLSRKVAYQWKFLA